MSPGSDDWRDPALASRFVDDAYASVKGYVRTYVLLIGDSLPSSLR